uniref:Uncharacterized protein n=1 Tax=Leptobrachium leishanense TaxID=445787 RepID=A0A8C5MYB3_9ANUR
MDTAELRKLRKKLRQIENLEHLQRELNASEITKVLQKLDLRRQVEQLLALGAEVKPLVRHAPPEEEQKPTACTSQSTRRTETLKLKPQSPPTNGAPKKTLKIPETSPLQSSAFLVHHLEGHSDLVTCVLIHGTSLISGSWDTSVRVWDIPSCSEQRTLCGHTGAVTSLTLLSLGGETLDPDIWPPDEEFVASGSSDCSIIVWSLTTGRPLFSVYTYSEVTSLVNVPKTQLVISGSGEWYHSWFVILRIKIEGGFRHHLEQHRHEERVTVTAVCIYIYRNHTRERHAGLFKENQKTTACSVTFRSLQFDLAISFRQPLRCIQQAPQGPRIAWKSRRKPAENSPHNPANAHRKRTAKRGLRHTETCKNIWINLPEKPKQEPITRRAAAGKGRHRRRMQ